MQFLNDLAHPGEIETPAVFEVLSNCRSKCNLHRGHPEDRLTHGGKGGASIHACNSASGLLNPASPLARHPESCAPGAELEGPCGFPVFRLLSPDFAPALIWLIAL